MSAIKTIVYRVEHRVCGTGPYRVGDLMGDTGWIWHTNSMGRPCPTEDGIKIWELGKEYKFGFASKKKLKRWFKRFESWLRQNNFVVVLYECENVAHGKRQTAFVPGRKLKTFEVSRILK